MDEKKISLKLKHISQSYIVDNKVFDAVVDVSLDVYKSEWKNSFAEYDRRTGKTGRR